MARVTNDSLAAEERQRYKAALNDYARHSLIRRMLADIVIDMTIAKEIRHTDPMEFPMMLKCEIDNIVEIWRQRERAKSITDVSMDGRA